MSSLFNDLNPAQKEAILHTDGPVMILAGAGSGKTRTLVARIIYLLEEKAIPAHQLLAVTFSNKAAREMRERVAETAGIESGAIQITTFHAFAARLLRNEANYLGIGRNFTIYDDSESLSIAKTILGKHGISPKEISPYALTGYIDDLKNNGIYTSCPEREDYHLDKSDVFYSYFLEYEGELARSNAVDFGGLITGVINLFENYPEVLERYQRRFKYILVDEYQDTNRAQFYLMKMLAGHYKNICVVGDEDQSIYSWRGADIRNILDFEKIYPETKLIKLEQNYRSSKTIISAASRIIARNEVRKGKEMWTANDEGDVIQIVECPDDKVEAEFISTEVRKLIQQGVRGEDIAVFYRNNSQSRIIEDALLKNNIPYRVVGGIRFYDRKEIKDVLSYLRLIVNLKDSLALSRVINTPTRGIGATTLKKLEDEAVRKRISLWDVIDEICTERTDVTLKVTGKISQGLKNFHHLICELKTYADEGARPHVITQKLLSESGLMESLRADKSYESMARIENIDELLNAIKQFEETTEKPTLAGLLEIFTLDQEAAQGEGEQSKKEIPLSLMTVHSSKGLEYPYVFVAGVEENMFPSYRSLEAGPMGIEEERRLFYVACTRAMVKLFISFAQGRMLWGDLKFNGPSRFIDEIPNEYYEWKRLKGREQYPSPKVSQPGVHYESYDDGWGHTETQKTPTKAIQKSPAATFPQGSRVAHSLYGEGVVLESEGKGNEEKVIIRFPGGVKKKFMVRYSPLVLL